MYCTHNREAAIEYSSSGAKLFIVPLQTTGSLTCFMEIIDPFFSAYAIIIFLNNP